MYIFLMSIAREFELLFDQSGLTQRRLAALLGTSHVTVNRWLKTERSDHVEPPFYALNFLRAYVMLPEGARARLPVFDRAAA